MANPTLANYYGSTLSSLITSNAAAIATDLGITAAQVTDPDKLQAALLVRLRAWLLADNTYDPGIAVQTFGSTVWEKGTDATNRPGQVSYALNLLIWQTDSNPADPNPASVV